LKESIVHLNRIVPCYLVSHRKLSSMTIGAAA
jgi:hypothetical protein